MSDEPEPESNWSELQPDILQSITQTLTTYSDYIRTRAVCHTWRSFLPPFPPHTLPSQLPWLLLPPSPPPSVSPHFNPVTRHVSSTCRNFYDLSTGKTHSLQLPEASYPRRIVGSSCGSLVLVGDSPEIFCFNPLTKSKVFLAPLSTIPGVESFCFSNVGREYSIRDPSSLAVYSLDLRQMRDVFIRKVILSDSPTRDGCIAVAIITSYLSATVDLVYYKCGDDRWRSAVTGGFSAEDVIYSQSEGLFYAVTGTDSVVVFDLTRVEIMMNAANSRIKGDLKYLVKFEGELLLVTRHLKAEADVVAYCEVYETTGFDVYRFHETGVRQVSWEPVSDLGDLAVFVGENSSLALLASDCPGCKGNCIYFTDDHSKFADVGVYNLSNSCIEVLPCLPVHWAPPVWLTPNPS